MKTINNITQLRAEKKQLQQHKAELEKKIHNNWVELKQATKPSSILREAWDKIMASKIEANLNKSNIIKSAIMYGLTLLTKKFSSRTEKN